MAPAADGGNWQASEAVVALGPWSNDLVERFGYRFPIGFKRGYHMHYERRRNGAAASALRCPGRLRADQCSAASA
jgi:glycine/D-amino acid oxidase-like deaminating enzyme